MKIFKGNAATEVEDDKKKIKPLVDADYTRPSDKNCDVVMKGGITSGVIYPLAICKLAQEYRLKSVGGSSAGAIAAAAAAAAERGRTCSGVNKLAGLPLELGQTLGSLFQAQKGTHAFMRILHSQSHPTRSGFLKFLGVVWALVAGRFPWFLVGFALGLAPGAAASVIAAGPPEDGGSDWEWILKGLIPSLPLALVMGLLGVLLALVWRLFTKVPRNYYGICNGMSGHRSKREALTPWLSRTLNDLAAVHPGPLTFGDLWGPEAVAAHEKLGQGSVKARRLRNVDLEMMTTDLGHGRPWRVPFSEPRFSFCPKEFENLFPKDVVDHMKSKSPSTGPDKMKSKSPSTGSDKSRCPVHPTETLLRLPDTPDLPVVVAARLSLSFPILLSAVPLYAVHEGKPVRCWFSDGGISSNFPIHFFDALWPTRPTFAIGLEKSTSVEDEPFTYPGAAPAPRRIGGVVEFLATILTTMQHWSDRGLADLPGYEDRIVTVNHTKVEGGMNLSMPEDRILRLAVRGSEAAQSLESEFKFPLHRRKRFQIAMSELDQTARLMCLDYSNEDITGGSYCDFLTEWAKKKGEDRQWALGAKECTASIMAGLKSYRGGSFSFGERASTPDPDLRITPHF